MALVFPSAWLLDCGCAGTAFHGDVKEEEFSARTALPAWSRSLSRDPDLISIGALDGLVFQAPMMAVGKGVQRATREVSQADDVARWFSEPKTLLRSKSKRGKRASSAACVRSRKPRPVDRTAAELVAAFCERCPAAGVKPSAMELQALADTCAPLPCSSVVAAFREQLSWSGGFSEWQPRARALHGLRYFSAQDGSVRIVAQRTIRETERILKHFVAEVPQCRELAMQLLGSSDTVMRVSSL
eukprot:CAMPEP_0115213054 /NCGR_PEP_ID=MMETSP0270-20121206/23600_1 /TAXON_ID=71861 /ORGANISM="Scrippsiella trochoidea, Strain CCMP3099" /LENGTH=242 /DNA_ID=CAMNT_0002626799 /DNA_START=43 /DNA_END=774 /DNA_ORIENTATION=+